MSKIYPCFFSFVLLNFSEISYVEKKYQLIHVVLPSQRIVDELKKEGFPIRIHVRNKHEGRGLSSAVLLGFQKVASIYCLIKKRMIFS